jgi:hypothetical protein
LREKRVLTRVLTLATRRPVLSYFLEHMEAKSKRIFED